MLEVAVYSGLCGSDFERVAVRLISELCRGDVSKCFLICLGRVDRVVGVVELICWNVVLIATWKAGAAGNR